ncbi:fasciclin domain-containing protein [Hyphobacterium sp. CCMP332]|nr:fasciclin domain-containing protein [Hyphobacterium sp. CCMP332]
MKKTGLFNYSKYLMAILLSASVVFFTSCGDDDEDSTPPPQTPSKTIAELAGETAGLDSLFAQLSAFPDLVAALSDTSATYTVFAPDNQAFVNLLATPGFPTTFDVINPDIIKGVLSYHVVPGQQISSGDLGPDMATLFDDPATGTNQVIMVNQDGTLLTGSTNDAITVITADIQASNGVIHIVESVMIPPSVGATLTPILGTLAGTVLLSADFSDLATLVNIADSDVPSGQAPIAGVLSGAVDSTANYTVFGPPNLVFEGGNIDPTSFNAATARAILLNHVVNGLNLSSSLSDGMMIPTLGGDTLNIAVNSNGVFVGLDSASIPVVSPDITDNISNGVIHAIGGIIQ